MKRNLEELNNAVEAIETRLTEVDGKTVQWQDDAKAEADKTAAAAKK